MFCEKIVSLALCAAAAISCCFCPWLGGGAGDAGSSSSSGSSSSGVTGDPGNPNIPLVPGGGASSAPTTPETPGGGASSAPTTPETPGGGASSTPTAPETPGGGASSTPTAPETPGGGASSTPTAPETPGGGASSTPTTPETPGGGASSTPTTPETPGGGASSAPTTPETPGGGASSTPTAPDTPQRPDIDFTGMLEDDLPPAAKKDFITFEDSIQDEDALQDALNSLVAEATGSIQEGQITPIYNTSPGYGQMVKDFVTARGIKNTSLKRGNTPDGMYYYFINNPTLDAAQPTKCAVLYAAPGSMGLEEAIRRVAAQVDPVLEKLPSSNMGGSPRYDYRYVVSTSAAGRSLTNEDGTAIPVYYVAVTVTRIPTAA